MRYVLTEVTHSAPLYGVTAAPGTNDTRMATTAFAMALLAPTVANGDTTHAPDGNAVFDALATKQGSSLVLTALSAHDGITTYDELFITGGFPTINLTGFGANTFPAKGSTGGLVAKTITDAALAALANMTAITAFTPTALGSTTAGVGTYTTQSGFYVRFGSIVFFKLAVAWTAHTGTGVLRITLPVTAANDSVNTPVISGIVDNYTLAAAANIAFDVLANTAQIRLLATPSGGGVTAGQTLDTAAAIQVAGFYFV